MGSIDKQSSLKITPLDKWHRENGGQMSAFGEYELPLWYSTGARAEHLTVLKAAGLFDTCHMSTILINGPGSFELFQRTFSRDLSAARKNGHPLSVGTGIYGVFLSEQGHLLDDAVIFQLQADSFLLCVNSGKGRLISEHLTQHNTFDCSISDKTGTIAKLDLQGPLSARILARIVKDPQLISQLRYFSCRGHFDTLSSLSNQVLVGQDIPVFLSRSGYTGELGFELFVETSLAERLWKTILAAGQQDGIMSCGLAARDSLRTGAGLPLSGQDIGAWPFINTPWDFALPWDSSGQGFTKSFIGDRALLQNRDHGFTHPFAGFDLRKVGQGKETEVLDQDNNTIGHVLTCATDMGTGRDSQKKLVSVNSPGLAKDFTPKGICCGFIFTLVQVATGDRVTLKDKRREIEVEIVEEIRPHRSARQKINIR